MTEPQSLETPWPNQTKPVDGVVPVEDVPQDPDLFADDPSDVDEMED